MSQIRYTKRPKLLDVGGAQVTYRGTRFGTIILEDEFRIVEWLPKLNVYVGCWRGTDIECSVPNWIRRARMRAYLDLTK